MRSPLSIPQLRLYVTLAALLVSAWWYYRQYHLERPIRVAVTGDYSDVLRNRARRSRVDSVDLLPVTGSTAGIEQLLNGDVDATIVQGGAQDEQDGVPILAEMAQLGLVRYEHVLYLRRLGAQADDRAECLVNPKRNPVVITFNEGQGSHLLGQRFYRQWGITPAWRHDWDEICRGERSVPEDADEVFVVVDPSDPDMRVGLQRVVEAGFRLCSADLGVFEDRLSYLQPMRVRTGYYLRQPPVPPERRRIKTYLVDNYLVASPDLTERQRRDLTRALVLRNADDAESEMLHSQGSSVVGDLADLFEMFVNFGFILAAWFGLEVLLHRRYIQELGALLTLLSMIQSERDVLGVDPALRERNVLYLETCGDLSGLVSALAGYYSHGNAALAFSGLTGFVHVRAHLLKLNIQLKLVQAAEVGSR